MCCSFGSVPFSLFVFGLEMHYSACPWLDDFYRNEILRRDFKAVEPYFDTQCGISGWALAGVSAPVCTCSQFIAITSESRSAKISLSFRYEITGVLGNALKTLSC
ncbi:unnamed protein product [Toxocara canis]|uniref:Secreted protein n=1 Tax=Toxocara canis TaxID=6265 RepID=A0A183URG1_TOXCA|nr:unnamed protein product [Toxocara canis]